MDAVLCFSVSMYLVDFSLSPPFQRILPSLHMRWGCHSFVADNASVRHVGRGRVGWIVMLRIRLVTIAAVMMVRRILRRMIGMWLLLFQLHTSVYFVKDTMVGTIGSGRSRDIFVVVQSGRGRIHTGIVVVTASLMRTVTASLNLFVAWRDKVGSTVAIRGVMVVLYLLGMGMIVGIGRMVMIVVLSFSVRMLRVAIKRFIMPRS
jgi:hypothetical protein